GSANLQTVRI
ncbi:periplasmic binding family protein, partial [Vibrio parahaemolyticus V-223/04]